MSSLVLFLTVFLACAVEAVEALTIVLAAGTSGTGVPPLRARRGAGSRSRPPSPRWARRSA